ncbi:MAG TPA: cation:proton antiporter [Candidatus Sulfotelmatobacter sp.]|jgi:CPA2 family monovalent cation:H+ antiporter-2|nr:cation:proton antiporter [Candidatus Sulfotelmatobacter sp.]
MPDLSDVTAVAVIALAALLCGVLFSRLKQPAIIGYIVAGALLGPAGVGLANNRDAVDVLAEFGVLMLLFLVGMQLDLRRFVAGWRVALLTTAMQIVGCVGVALALSPLLGWNPGLSILLGFIVSVSSTAVVIKILESSDEIATPAGRMAIGILIAQDMAVVPMMMVLSALSRKGFNLLDLAKVGGSILFLVLLFFILLRYRVRLPFASTVAKHQDLSPLTGLAWCFGAATLASLLGLSPAYGAFLAGVVIGNSTQRASMLQSSQPIQSILMMVFFVSVGLLLDPRFIWQNLGTVLSLLLMVTVFKTLLNIGALKLLGESWPRCVMVGVSLAQIGEFSFVLAGIGKDNRLLGAQEARLVVTVTVLSLMLSPFWLMAARRLHKLGGNGAATSGDILRVFDFRDLPVLRRFRPESPSPEESA